ncbi:DUF7269 family protein [Halobaculum lipolyticum]|uniref:Uncharacterized protein n=1 Tax=Halobaculum lipolyticum TaxID=3032001 RepID=A0ABD5WH43_9EURY|nr:hypothetical protein [Halobaculum sp. DT31]
MRSPESGAPLALATVAVVAGVGAVAVLLGLPGTWFLTGVGVQYVLWLFGIAVVCVAGWLVRDVIVPPPRRGSRVDGDPRRGWDAPLVGDEPERIELGDERPLGAAITVAAGDDDRLAREHGPEPAVARGRARRRLREVATAELAAAEGLSASTAERRIDAGEWTDDVRAAAYLSDGPTPSVPPVTRLRDWLAGERTARSVRATVRAVEALERRSRGAGGRTDGPRRSIRSERADAAAGDAADRSRTGDGTGDGAGGADAADPDSAPDREREGEHEREGGRERVYPKPAAEAVGEAWR